jgi:hypothetical protein
MPGLIDAFAGSDFLSDFALYRTTTDTDASAAAAGALDFTKSKSALENNLLIVPKRLSGTGRVNYKFYARFQGPLGLLADPWFLHKQTGLQSTLTIVSVTGLIGTLYHVLIEHENGGADSFETYLSTSIIGTF